MDIQKYTDLHKAAVDFPAEEVNPCEEALVEGFITGTINGRNGERERLYEKLVAYQGGYIESDMVVIPTTIPIDTVFQWLRK